MAIRYAIDNGPWHQPTTWLDGILPQSGDSVYANGFNVEIDMGIPSLALLSTEKYTIPGTETTINRGGGFTLRVNGGTLNITTVQSGTDDCLTVDADDVIVNATTIYGGQPVGLISGSHVGIISTRNVIINVSGFAIGRSDHAVLLSGQGVVNGNAIGGAGAIDGFGDIYYGDGVMLQDGAVMNGDAEASSGGLGSGVSAKWGGIFNGDAYGRHNTISGTPGARIYDGGAMLGDSYGDTLAHGAEVYQGGFQRGNAFGSSATASALRAYGSLVHSGGMFEGNATGGAPTIGNNQSHGILVRDGGFARVAIATGTVAGVFGAVGESRSVVVVEKTSGNYPVSIGPNVSQDPNDLPFYRKGGGFKSWRSFWK